MLQKLRDLILLPLLALTLLFTPKAADTPSAAFVSQDVFLLKQALVMGQGVTTDGEYYYTSGAITALDLTALAKYTFPDAVPVLERLNPLPEQCTQRGNNHIGGISCYKGKIYASVEGGDPEVPCVVAFDCETLLPTGEVWDLPRESFPDGVPWLAVDGQTGLLYASPWSHAKTLYVFDVNDNMRPVNALALTGLGELDRIQGGEFYNGRLYLSQDCRDGGTLKNVLTVNTQTGEVSVLAQRDIGAENSRVEAEGLTVWPAPDGSLVHVLDYNKAVGIFLRHYKLPAGE